ncbi:MAG: hypothetical protein IKB01_01335 [Lachnospiraceae bacterium]|nr:hypothetical protein [Lachnospiraceae bacterium]
MSVRLHKAQIIDSNEWVEGYLSKCEGEFVIVDNEGIGKFIKPDTICLDTGKTDKNEKKFWENDIVRDNEDDLIMVVRWDNEKAAYVLDDYGTKGCLMEYGWDETAGEFGVVDTYEFDDFCNPINEVLEVIGNIFDNPELIKGGK